MNSAFGARWLASLEVISQVLLTCEHRAVCKTLKIDHFLLIVTDIVVFGTIYSTCVVYTKTIIIHLGVSECSVGYLPHHFTTQQISTTIHLHLRE